PSGPRHLVRPIWQREEAFRPEIPGGLAARGKGDARGRRRIPAGGGGARGGGGGYRRGGGGGGRPPSDPGSGDSTRSGSPDQIEPTNRLEVYGPQKDDAHS